MTENVNSSEVVRFMTLFQDLKNLIDDDPEGLIDLSAEDEVLKRLCIELFGVRTILSMNERRRRNLFMAPVDPNFISAWRDYEERFQHVLADIWLANILPGIGGDKSSQTSRADIQWENADDDASKQMNAIRWALDFAHDQVTDEGRDFPEGFPESIEDGVAAWDRLKDEAGFDLRGAFRRRELVPIVLVPRHVAGRYGSAERLSLYTHLQQAHDAFIFGAPFAALALMRSILETMLRDHYSAQGVDLKERIDSCRSLPSGANKAALHRLRKLANAVLHLNEQTAELPRTLEPRHLEKEIISLLFVLRALIEGAPARRTR